MKDDRNMTERGMKKSEEKKDDVEEKKEQLSRADIKRWRRNFQSFGVLRKDRQRAK